MKTSTFIFCCGVLFIIASSCKSPQPMLNNLHHGKMGNEDTELQVVEVKVGILPYKSTSQEPDKPKLLWDLKDSLSYHLLREIGNKTKKPEEIIALMSRTIYPAATVSPTPLPTDYTEYKVRLAFSNIKRYFIDKKFTHPNTRLAYLNTYVSIPETEDGIVFKSIDKLENEFEEVDLGDISRNQSATFNSKLIASGQIGSSIDNTNTVSSDKNKTTNNGNENTVYDQNGNAIGVINNSGKIVRSNNNTNTTTTKSGASASITGEVGYINTETINEAKRVKLQRMKAGFSFDPKEITVSQEGRQSGDITNNVFVDATIKFKGKELTDDKTIYVFKNLFNDQYQPTAVNNINFEKRTISYVKCLHSKLFKLNVEYEGLLRAVENIEEQTGENNLEYDDKVTMYHIKKRAGKNATIDPMIFCKYVYRVTAKTPQNKILNLRISSSTDQLLDLFSEDKPEEFIKWLYQQIENGDPKNLSSDKFELYFPTSYTEKIDVVKKKMTSEDLQKLKQLEFTLEVETE